MKTSLDLLNNILVASPCHADWDEMTGDDRVRFCGLCEKNVYNLSALTSEQSINLIREKEGRLCVRFFQRTDGTMLTADCPVGATHRIRRKRWKGAAAISAAGLLTVGGYAAYEVTCVQGEMPTRFIPETELLPTPREVGPDAKVNDAEVLPSPRDAKID